MGESKFHTPTGNRDKEMPFALVEVICASSKLSKMLACFYKLTILRNRCVKAEKAAFGKQTTGFTWSQFTWMVNLCDLCSRLAFKVSFLLHVYFFYCTDTRISSIAAVSECLTIFLGSMLIFQEEKQTTVV